MRNIPTQVVGGILTPGEFNDIPDELEHAITDSGQTLTSADLYQLSKAMSAYAAGGDFYTDSGAADAYVLSTVGAKQGPPVYFNGMRCRFRPTANNTGASTVNVDGIGVANIKLADGASNPAAGDISTASDCEIVYDGTNFRIVGLAKPSLVLASGAKVTEISTTTTLGASDAKVPTQNAVKTYVDTEIAGASGTFQWNKYTKTYADFSAGATTNSITLVALPAKRMVHGVVIKHSTAFSGGGITSYTVEVGVAANVAKYASAFDTFQAVSDTTGQTYMCFGLENFGASTNLLATATASHNLNMATAGSVDIWLLTSNLT